MTPRPRWGLVAIAALIGAALVIAGSAVLSWHLRFPNGQRVRVLHEDLSAAGTEQDAVALLQHVSDMYQFIATQRYAQAGAQVSVTKLVSVLVPLRPHVDRWGRLSGDLLSGVREVDAAIIEAETLLRANRPAEARRVLIQARRLLRRNGGFVQQNRQSLLELANRLGVPTLPSSSPARRVLDRGQRALGMVDARNRRIAALLQRVEKGERVSLGPVHTFLRWAVPARAYPARPFVASGVVTSAGRSDLPRDLIFDLDGRVLTQLLVPGRFRVVLTPPADFPPGGHALTVLVEASGEYTEVTETRPLELVKYPLAVTIDPVSTVLVPGTITVSGRVRSPSGPVAQARVEVRLGAATAITNATSDGRFRVTVAAPLMMSLVGPQRVRVSVFPAVPWEAPAEAETRATVVNLINLGLAAAFTPVAAVYIRTRRRTRKGAAARTREGAGSPQEAPGTAGVAIQRAADAPSEPDDAGLSLVEQVVRLYGAAVRRIEEKKSVRLKPHMTLREFQRVAAPHLRGHAFAQMTALAEFALYSSGPIAEERVASMLRLSGDLDKELGGHSA